jgi:hypothetical protein
MSFESFFSPDNLTTKKEEILGKLEKDGLTDLIREEIVEWRKEREKLNMAIPTADGIVRLNYEMAQIYEYAGDINEMFLSLDEALNGVVSEIANPLNSTAVRENLEKMARMMEDRINEMEKKYPA